MTTESNKKTSFYEVVKLTEHVKQAKENNDNIDDFIKYPMYRGIKYKSEESESILRLCSGFNKPIQDGQWIVEQPKMVDNKIQYEVMDDKDYKDSFTKYDARGVLGCGPGSERFVKK